VQLILSLIENSIVKISFSNWNDVCLYCGKESEIIGVVNWLICNKSHEEILPTVFFLSHSFYLFTFFLML
jgi:hypothetical protein